MRGPYTPQLPAKMIHELWLRKEATGQSMAEQLREAVSAYLALNPPPERTS